MYPDNIGNQDWANGIHHNMEYVAYKAVEFIQANHENDWFLYVNPTVPHGPGVEEAMDVDCRITTDGDFTSTLDKGWSVDGMTKEFGDDCDLYRADVKARAGTNTNANLGSICKYSLLYITIVCHISVCLTSLIVFEQHQGWMMPLVQSTKL